MTVGELEQLGNIVKGLEQLLVDMQQFLGVQINSERDNNG